jgi:hypothetical protein
MDGLGDVICRFHWDKTALFNTHNLLRYFTFVKLIEMNRTKNHSS